MGAPPIVEREWILYLSRGEVQIRCRYRRSGNRILDYTAQLEIDHNQMWQPIVRYDNAHGFCHCDTIHPDGSQDKVPLLGDDANVNFTWAINELRINWPAHRARFLSEVKS